MQTLKQTVQVIVPKDRRISITNPELLRVFFDDEDTQDLITCQSCGENVFKDTVEQDICPFCGLDIFGRRTAVTS